MNITVHENIYCEIQTCVSSMFGQSDKYSYDLGSLKKKFKRVFITGNFLLKIFGFFQIVGEYTRMTSKVNI